MLSFYFCLSLFLNPFAYTKKGLAIYTVNDNSGLSQGGRIFILYFLLFKFSGEKNHCVLTNGTSLSPFGD